MALARYEAWLADPYGNRVAVLDQLTEFSLVKSVNQIGQWSVTYPLEYFDPNWHREDMILDVWRRGADGNMQRQIAGFLTRLRYFHDSQDRPYVEMSGPDTKYLLDKNIVAYAAGTSYASKSGEADDLMKEVIRENLGASATDTDRDLSAYGFSVEADHTLGPSIDRSFSWLNVLAVLKKMQDAARQIGTAVYFDVVPTWQGGRIGFQFRTYINQRGLDRTVTSANPTLLGIEYGNVKAPEYTIDWQDERNYIYVGGQGTGTDRAVEEVSDTARTARSPWRRREHFQQATNESTTAALQDRGYTELENRRLVETFRAEILSVPGAEYGIDWDFGDKLTINYAFRQFDGTLDAIALDVGADGSEQITARFEVG